jgi:hypothetical protein
MLRDGVPRTSPLVASPAGLEVQYDIKLREERIEADKRLWQELDQTRLLRATQGAADLRRRT